MYFINSLDKEMIYFLQSNIILDVRSPQEFSHSHIPNAQNLPLFSDEERHLVGTCYKQKGKEKAIELGLEFVGPKMSSLVQRAKEFGSEINLYCARGGMRSQSVAWLLNLSGLKVTPLKGGYKKFRNWVIPTLSKLKYVFTVGGFTGSGKSIILKELEKLGEQVIDLETLAAHKGSSFGYQKNQPTNEHFENLLAYKIATFNLEKPVWIEDESRMVGTCKVPDPLFEKMRKAPLFKIERALNERVNHLLNDYADVSNETLLESTQRLQKRLGRERTQEALQCIKNNRRIDAIKLLLEYYDGTYTYGLSKRTQPIALYPASNLSFTECAEQLIKRSREYDTSIHSIS